MAERRMFAKAIIDSDAFLEMPMSARLLYYDLGMRADDDGFINSPKKIMRMTGSSNDDMNILIMRKFVIPFDNGVVVIKHWRINNYLRKDRYTSTQYFELMDKLTIDDKGGYHLKKDDGTPSGIPTGIPTVSTGKDSIGKDSIGKDNNIYISPPSSKEDAEDYANVEELPCSDGSFWRCKTVDYEEFCRLYPNVDITQEFRKMRGWLNTNPKKTKRGMSRFVNGWLARSQDKARKDDRHEPQKQASPTKADSEWE